MAEQENTQIEGTESQVETNPGEVQSTEPQTGDAQPANEPQASEAPSFQIEGFNKHFNASFESEDSIKEVLEKANKINDIELELQQAKDQASTVHVGIER